MTVSVAPAASAAAGSDAAARLDAGALRTLDVADLLRRFGSPLYLYDLDLVGLRAARLRAALPARVRVAYAVKANPSLAVVSVLGRLGLGVDVASYGELLAVERAGVPMDRVVMTGPGKPDDELRAAVRRSVGVITVESESELGRLDRIAAEEGVAVRVLLRRTAPTGGAGTDGEPFRAVGDAGVGKFGMDDAAVARALRAAAASPWLEPLGIHAFGASNVRDASLLLGHARATVAFARELFGGLGLPLRLVDLGGGLGIPASADDAALDLGTFAAGLAAIVDGLQPETELLLEPGRWLAGPAGAYLTTVVDVKTNGGRRVAVVDGGVHHLLRPALVGAAHEVVRATVHAPDDQDGDGHPEAARTRVAIVGRLCSGLDVLARDVLVPPVREGDVLGFLDAGAYGFTESMPWFLSHAGPAEVGLREGAAQLLRPRLDPASLLDLQWLPG